MGPGGTLTIKQTSLLVALLQGESVETAARCAKLSRSTAYRVYATQEFQEALAEAKNDLFQRELALLQKEGLAALKRHITADVEPTPASQIQAIRVVSEELRMATELAEIRSLMEQFKEELARLGYYE